MAGIVHPSAVRSPIEGASAARQGRSSLPGYQASNVLLPSATPLRSCNGIDCADNNSGGIGLPVGERMCQRLVRAGHAAVLRDAGDTTDAGRRRIHLHRSCYGLRLRDVCRQHVARHGRVSRAAVVGRRQSGVVGAVRARVGHPARLDHGAAFCAARRQSRGGGGVIVAGVWYSTCAVLRSRSVGVAVPGVPNIRSLPAGLWVRMPREWPSSWVATRARQAAICAVVNPRRTRNCTRIGSVIACVESMTYVVTPSHAPSAPTESGGTSGGTLSCQRTMTSARFESATSTPLNSPYRNWLSQTLSPRLIRAGIAPRGSA